MARTTIATTEGARSQTLLETAPNLSHHTPILTGTLRLRAVPAESRHIRWSEDVIDNEGLGRKKSKRNVPLLLLPQRKHPPPIDLFRRAALVGGIWSLLLTTYSRLVCCIYHKTREAGESSSEDDSGSDSSSDSGRESDDGNLDDGRARMSRETKRENGRLGHGNHNDECGHCGGEGSSVGKGGVRKKRRNAYEKAPKVPETKKWRDRLFKVIGLWDFAAIRVFGKESRWTLKRYSVTKLWPQGACAFYML